MMNNNPESMNEYIKFCNLGGDPNNFSAKNMQKLTDKINKSKDKKVYLNWRNDKGRDCKNIGPATKCFCDHRLKSHNYLNPKSGNNVNCVEKKCLCNNFTYIPVHGSYDFKCLCKHSYKLHNPFNYKCTKCNCSCLRSTWSCSCGLKYGEHKTVAETRAERIAKGLPVSEIENILTDNMIIDSNNNNLVNEGFINKESKYNNNNDFGLKNFCDLVDHNERFESKIDDFKQYKPINKSKNNQIIFELYNTPHNFIKVGKINKK